MVRIHRALPAELADVARFYSEMGYHALIEAGGAVFLARVGDRLVGAVWLEHAEGLWVLRGMRVRPEHQRLGIGTRLLAAALASVPDAPCYCVPYTHVGRLLERGGFTELSPAEQPPLLRARATAYRQRGQDVVVMRRATAADSVPLAG